MAEGSGQTSSRGVLTLPDGVLAALHDEARRSRKPVPTLIGQWLEDLADERALQRALKAAKGRKPISAQELYRQCGL